MVKFIFTAVLLVLVHAASAAQYYVKTTGNDSLDGLSIGNAWLTIQKAADTLVAGDTVTISAGDYPETVQETTDGSSGSPITYLADGVVTVDQFRVDGYYIVLSGLTIDTPTEALWGGNVLVTDAHNLIVTNCTFGPMPLAFGTNFTFHASGVVSNPAVNFTTMGFKANQPVWLAGYTETNGPGDFIYPFTNGFKVVTNASVGTTTMTLTGISTNESPQWIAMYPGMDKEGYSAIEQLGSGTRATNVTITHCNFKSVWGQCVNMNLNRDWLVVSNTFDIAASFKMIIPSGTNITLRGNFFRNGTNFIYGSSAEIGRYSHEVDQYAKIDWIFGQIHPSAAVIGDFVAEYNWFQGRHNDLAQFAAGSGQTNNTWRYNVFVGVSGPPNGAQDGYRWQSNTFYRVGYGTAESVAILAQSGKTVDITGNVFVDIGSHSSTNTLPYSTTSSTGVTVNYNFLAQAETLKFQGYTGFSEANGINGGDPMFMDVWNPLGADGLPFTADDGLRPMPTSPIAALGIGALSPATLSADTPIAHFKLTVTTPEWKDSTSEDSAWLALNFWDRTNAVRPWFTAENIGDRTDTVSFDASDSISGTWSTNDWKGIKWFRWNFGDGSIVNTLWPEVDHVYLTSGAFPVALTVFNSAGNSASVTNYYRIDTTAPSETIISISTSGNDTTGTGSEAAPYLTIAKGVSVATAGDFIQVVAGSYAEYVDVNNNVGTTNAPVKIMSFGASSGGFKVRHSNWQIWGFDLNYSPTDAADATIYNYVAADNSVYKYNYIHDTPESIYGVELLAPASFGPLDGPLNVQVVGNIFTNIGHIAVQAFNSSNLVVDANYAVDTWGEGDFVRPLGVNNVVKRNRVLNLNNGATGGHSDFFQIPQPGSLQNILNLLIERNWIEGQTNLTIDSGAITISKTAGDNPVVASSAIFQPYMSTDEMSIVTDGTSTTLRITNYISSTQVNVSSASAITAETFQIVADDAAIAQMASDAFGSANFTNQIWRNNVFVNVRGTMSDSFDGIKMYNNTFINSPRTGGNATAGGGVNGSSYGTRFTNNIFYMESGRVDTISASTGWYYIDNDSGNPGSNTTVFADYDLVFPAKTGALWTYNSMEANGINGSEPDFGDGYMLPESSPAYGAGVDLSGLPGIEEFSTDFWGETRTVWSLGAFEFAPNSSGDAEPYTPTIVTNTARAGNVGGFLGLRLGEAP